MVRDIIKRQLRQEMVQIIEITKHKTKTDLKLNFPLTKSEPQNKRVNKI